MPWSRRSCRWARCVTATEQERQPSEDGAQYEFLPSAESILEEVVPTSFKVKLFKCFLDAAVSEQVARMVAMKAATENADKIIKQSVDDLQPCPAVQITGEIMEVHRRRRGA